MFELTFTCLTKCGLCCGIIPVPKEIWECNKEKALNVEEVKEAEGFVFPMTSTLTCCFLTDEKQCSIYEARPEVCRLYGSGLHDDLLCQFLKPNGNKRSEAQRKRLDRELSHRLDKTMEKIRKEGY